MIMLKKIKDKKIHDTPRKVSMNFLGHRL